MNEDEPVHRGIEMMRRSCQEAEVRGESAGDCGEEGEAVLFQDDVDDGGPLLGEVVTERADGRTLARGWPVPEQHHLIGGEGLRADALACDEAGQCVTEERRVPACPLG
eukprot:7815143-Heterocapsa_arctica.AAC.1